MAGNNNYTAEKSSFERHEQDKLELQKTLLDNITELTREDVNGYMLVATTQDGDHKGSVGSSTMAGGSTCLHASFKMLSIMRVLCKEMEGDVRRSCRDIATKRNEPYEDVYKEAMEHIEELSQQFLEHRRGEVKKAIGEADF